MRLGYPSVPMARTANIIGTVVLVFVLTERIASIDGATPDALHETIREQGGVRITIGDDGRPSFAPPPERPDQD